MLRLATAATDCFVVEPPLPLAAERSLAVAAAQHPIAGGAVGRSVDVAVAPSVAAAAPFDAAALPIVAVADARFLPLAATDWLLDVFEPVRLDVELPQPDADFEQPDAEPLAVGFFARAAVAPTAIPIYDPEFAIGGSPDGSSHYRNPAPHQHQSTSLENVDRAVRDYLAAAALPRY